MFTLQGKTNSCIVYTNNTDNATISQLMELLNLESVRGSNIRIMPDTHAGVGCVIGATMTISDKVIPNLVGVDIGCGMLTTKLEEKEIDLEKLDKIIHQYIPAGFDIHERPIAHSDIDSIIAPIDVKKEQKSLGSLGGGNHFIEVDKDSNGNLYLVIHTGSRHLGISVCKYYQDLAHMKIKRDNIKVKIDDTVKKLKHDGKEKDIENTIKILKMQASPIPKDLCHVEGDDFDNYIHDMKLAQEHAKINRATIADQIISRIGLHIVDQFDTIHNYIDIENMILRKGSISAQKDEIVLIPMNMRDGSLICKGKGNPDWNYSAPHGAGRVMSRKQANENISLDDYKASMKGIYSTCVTNDTKDESPMVYKPMDEIIENIKETVEIIDIIKPIYNFKAK